MGREGMSNELVNV